MPGVVKTDIEFTIGKVEDGVPVPPKGARSTVGNAYQLAELKVGQSRLFTIKTPGKRENFRGRLMANCAAIKKKHKGRNYTSRNESRTTVRVWRIK